MASASVMRSTAVPSRKAGHVGPLSGHAAQITDLRTLSWSSGAAQPPGGTSWFPLSLRRSTASKGRFLIPLVVPWLAQLNHPYTSPTRGRASSPRGSGTVPQSRSQGRAPSAPRAGSPCCPCACGASAAPRPPPAQAICAGSALGAGGGWLVLGSRGLGGDELSGVGVIVVEVVVVVVVVVGVVRRHLLDARKDAPHRLHVRLRGCPAPRPPPFDPPSPPGSHAPSRLSLGALAPGPLSGPHASVPLPVPWVLPPVTHAPACLLAHRPSLHSMHLGALLAPLRALPVPWPLPGSLPCIAPAAARALCPSAAAGLGAPPLLLAACALARSLRVPLGTSSVASCPPLRAPVAGTQLCPRAVPSFLDHPPGFPLPLQLRRDARRRALRRQGADVPRPPLGEGLGGKWLGGAGVGVGGVGVGAVPRALPAHCCCCGGRRRGACGSCGVRPPLSWRAWGRGVAGRGGGAARRGRGCNPLCTLPAPLCGCGSPR